MAAAALVLALLGTACSTDRITAISVTGGASRTIWTHVGSELRITLETVGPGEYDSPPAVSSPSVRFLDVSPVKPEPPATSVQRFRFQAVARGRAIIVFRHTGAYPVIEDTIEVR